MALVATLPTRVCVPLIQLETDLLKHSRQESGSQEHVSIVQEEVDQ